MPQGKYKNKAYPLRIDEELMQEIKEISEKEDRTVNKQIEYILKIWVEDYKNKNKPIKGLLSNTKIG